MCGIVGFLNKQNPLDRKSQDLIRRMSAKLSHRGPDDSGIWSDSETGIALGHQRLAIQDLSPAGKQPMRSKSGRYQIVYNGEIYNAKQLVVELVQGSQCALDLVGHSDTEVLLASIEAWGLQTAVSKCIGMFAFALWDKNDEVLHLVRDRLGIKPLYYGQSKNTFLFGSELKALKEHPDFESEIDRNALALYFRHNYIPAPYSIYKSCKKLEPGSILTVSRKGFSTKITNYWGAWETINTSRNNPFVGSYEDAIDRLEELLSDSIRLRMLSDVPLGAFLSGGIDSSLVVALMQKESSRPVRTFSIGFEDDAYDEAPFAKDVAKHLGSDHTELYVTAKQALEVIPRLPQIYDEPFADSSQIPTILLSELTKKHVTVALSGDGGDELFSGYSRYRLANLTWNRIRMFPSCLKFPLQRLMSTIPEQVLNLLYKPVSPFMPNSLRLRNPGKNIHRLAELMKIPNERRFYLSMISHLDVPSRIVKGAIEPETKLTQGNQPQGLSFNEWMMAQDLVSYLPDDILTKVDRASMAASLEARVPLLDHRVVDFAWGLPFEWKRNQTQSKRILKDVLYRHVPKSLLDRPKVGFGVPLDQWMRGPLRDWAESLIEENRLRQEGFLDTDLVRTMWTEHLSGKKNWQGQIWDVLMFQAWLEKQ
jgi:asparagine synthase (glutamine-hydrolysing)